MNPSLLDLIIIGGGINGAALANIASSRGLRVAVFEKNDFASGTSSKSTKLLHGGLRYLENFEFGLVRESLCERYRLWQAAPHLVHPLRFIIPVYRDSPRPLWMLRLGVALYDALSGRYCFERHRKLTKDEVCRALPEINRDGLTGGIRYADGQMDDARLCLENVLSAREQGAVTMNYTEVTAFLKDGDRVRGVRTRDALSGEEREWHGRAVVAAVGPWTNRVCDLDVPSFDGAKVRPTKGAHVVYARRLTDEAVLIQASEGRIFFVIPWGEHSLIGTTDTDFGGDPDGVEAEPSDINYLFGEAAKVFPGENFSADRIVTAFAGLRPLIYQQGRPGKVSRTHRIVTSPSGVTYILGGKYTTFRVIAEDALAHILKQPAFAGWPDVSGNAPSFSVYGSGKISRSVVEDAREFSLPTETAAYLRSVYGVRYADVLSLCRQDVSLKDSFCTCSPAIRAQIVYARDREMARAPDDVVWRRLGLAYRACREGRCRDAIAHYFSGSCRM